MENEPRTFARLGLGSTYFEIATECFLDYKKHKTELDKVKSEGGEWIEGIFVYYKNEDYSYYSERLRKDTIKSIIFLCTFLESYIYDFAGIVLGDNYVKTHLDKLDLISKWVIIPKLITGQDIDKSKLFFSRFKELVKWRNKLIHPKSKDAFTYFSSEIDFKSKTDSLKPIYELVNIEQFFFMTEDLFQELDKIDKPGFHLIRIKDELDKIK